MLQTNAVSHTKSYAKPEKRSGILTLTYVTTTVNLLFVPVKPDLLMMLLVIIGPEVDQAEIMYVMKKSVLYSKKSVYIVLNAEDVNGYIFGFMWTISFPLGLP